MPSWIEIKFSREIELTLYNSNVQKLLQLEIKYKVTMNLQFSEILFRKRKRIVTDVRDKILRG